MSNATVAIGGEKQRLALAKKWNESAEEQLESAKAHAKALVEIAESQVAASRKEVEDAEKHLKSVEEEHKVVDVDLDDDSLSSGYGKDGA